MSRVASRFLVVAMATLLATGWLTARPLLATAAGTGSVSLTTLGAAVGEEFDGLASTGTANTTLPTGWFLHESGTSSANNDAYAAGTGSANAGDVYSFGAADNAERALGTLLSGTLTPTIGASFTNSTGSQISALDISYAGEQWRLGALGSSGTPPRGPDRLDFQYSLDATSLTTGTWIHIDSLDFTSPIQGPTVGFLDGNNAANRTAITAVIPDLAIGAGATFWIRWTDFNVASSDDGLGIDGFSLTPRGTPGINLSINDVSKNESTGSQLYDFTVSLSNPAGPGGVTFDIATQDNTATTANNDYIAQSLTGQTIAAGESSYLFSVTVNGDTTPEPNETFFVNISNVTGATIADGQGLGTIQNDDGPVNTCGSSYTPIFQIQGSGTATPIGQPNTTTTEGIVVGDFEGADAVGFLGFHIQDPAGDANTATSDGLYIFTGSNNKGVNPGDRVRVTGNARERFGETTISGGNTNTSAVPPENILICSTGNTLPTATQVTLPLTAVSDLEKYEGMRVTFPQELVIAEYFNYDRFGELVLALPIGTEARPFTPTSIDEPGSAAWAARNSTNLLSRITLDDGLNVQNPGVTRHPNGLPFSLSNRFRGGDKVQNAAGVLGFAFSVYRIQPTGAADYTPANPRPGTPEDVGGGIKVAVMNTLNFFLTLDTTASDSGPGPCGGNQNLDCRGADAAQPQEFTRQRDKLLQALAGINADVLGLNEIENTPGVSPLGDEDDGILVGLNEILGEGTYDYIDTGVIGTDAIRVGLMYKPGMVTPVGDFEVLTTAVDPRFLDTKSRPALAQTFYVNETGARFTVVVNHLKSKGSNCNDVGDPIDPNGQGNCNGTRTLAAQALVDWLATDPTNSGDPDFAIIGDLNSYAMEDPIDAIKAGSDGIPGNGDDYTNLIAMEQGTYAYSYTFDGMAGYLDHALGNASFTDQVTGAAEWHINSDEPDILDYDTSFKSNEQDALYEANQYRSSDHDPVIIGLDLLNAAPTFELVSAASCATGAGGTFNITIDDYDLLETELTLGLTANTNTTLVPNANVVVTGTGANRTISITAASSQSGSAALTFTLSDGWNEVPLVITVKIGSGANDVLTGTSGVDLLVGGGGEDSLTGLGDVDILCAGKGEDALDGGDGNDLLGGGIGDDVLLGGAGDDVLLGQGGDDTLTGGVDADAFSGGTGVDTNTDFNAGDGDTSDGT